MTSIAELSKGVPSKFKILYEKALRGLLAPRSAIKAKCQECVNWEDIRLRVGQCQARGCPLWSLRPYQNIKEPPTPAHTVDAPHSV